MVGEDYCLVGGSLHLATLYRATLIVGYLTTCYSPEPTVPHEFRNLPERSGGPEY